MNFNEEQRIRLDYIEAVMERFYPAETGYEKTVLEAMNYSMRVGGKRIRPMLMLETFRLFDSSNTDLTMLEAFFTGIEMIHNYSLVHDDLPAMDDDMYRRGRKTTHAVYGESMGILAGDGLLNFAFEITSNAVSQVKEFTLMQRGTKALSILAQKSGHQGMLGGQCADLEQSGQTADKDKLDFIYRLKTGALIEASMIIGAVLSGADQREQEIIQTAAQKIGLAFQIQDDVLDVTGTFEEFGKVANRDERNSKFTYVSLLGIENAKEKVEKYSGQAAALLNQLNQKNEFLELLIHSLIHRTK